MPWLRSAGSAHVTLLLLLDAEFRAHKLLSRFTYGPGRSHVKLCHKLLVLLYFVTRAQKIRWIYWPSVKVHQKTWQWQYHTKRAFIYWKSVNISIDKLMLLDIEMLEWLSERAKRAYTTPGTALSYLHHIQMAVVCFLTHDCCWKLRKIYKLSVV